MRRSTRLAAHLAAASASRRTMPTWSSRKWGSAGRTSCGWRISDNRLAQAMGRRTAKRTGATQADLELSLTTLTLHGTADAEKDLRGALDLNPDFVGAPPLAVCSHALPRRWRYRHGRLDRKSTRL